MDAEGEGGGARGDPPPSLDEAVAALRRISQMQQNALRIIRDNGFVFDDLGCEPGNWQHLAFTLYTELCEVDTIARNALGIGWDLTTS